MSKSLQDQLLALGLAKEKSKPGSAQKSRNGGGQRHDQSRPASPRKDSARAAAKPTTAQKNSSPHVAPDITPESITLEQAYRIREKEEKSAKQRARDLKMEADRQRAALNRQIRNIVDAGRLNLADAGEARYFMYKDRIRKVYASAEQLAGLNEGSLGVVYLAGGYHILAAEHIETVRQISPDHVADLLSGASDDDELGAAYEQANEQANEKNDQQAD
jgi:uncharacterized protein YaiL (DUF2058 family)